MSLNETLAAGRLHWPGEAGYDERRLPWQRKFDPRPAAILDARDANDVRAALEIMRDNNLPLTVQATGHGAAQPADGTLLLRTGDMRAVEVDGERWTARVAAGTPWGDVIAAAAPYGLAPLSGTSATVAVAGYTVGGGAGLLSRAFGYAADSVIRFDVVLADGQLVTASEDENPDLFWALRGGGGNFGIVTALEFRLHPVERVYGGTAMYDVAAAGDMLAAYREWAPGETDESSTAVAVLNLPPLPQLPEAVRGRKVAAFRGLYLGGAADAERAWAPLRAAGGEPLLDGMQPMTYPEASAALSAPPNPMVAELYIDMFEELPDAVLDVVADSPVMSMELRHWRGAPASAGPDAGPIGHRDVPYSVVANAMAPDRDGYAAIKAAVGSVATRLRPHAHGGTFLNFLGDPSRVPTAYTAADYARLQEIKAVYDPENVFGRGLNIPPAAE